MTSVKDEIRAGCREVTE